MTYAANFVSAPVKERARKARPAAKLAEATHLERIRELAREADGGASGVNLVECSREDRRRRLLGV